MPPTDAPGGLTPFVPFAKVKQELSLGARHRDVEEADGIYALREPANAYRCDFGTENAALRAKNAVFSAHNPVNT